MAELDPLDNDLQRSIIDRVAEECFRHKVDGVFAISSPGVIYWELIRRKSVLDDASDGRKYNLLAIALAKCAVALAHQAASGEIHYEGEPAYRGGIYSDGCAYAFAGGTEDQDVHIAEVAAWHHKYKSTPRFKR